jgi:CubicO group peptidase (beta-lactamase class C family)
LTGGLKRVPPSEVQINADAVGTWLDDLDKAGSVRQTLLIYRDGAIGVEAHRWPYGSECIRMTHSVTKSFTSAAVGLALSEGRFRLEDKVVDFFPEYRPAVVSERLAAMTVENLLTMRTGQAVETSGSRWRGLKTSWIAEFFRIPIEHDPGKRFLYTSAASYMLGSIVTRTSGIGLHEYMRHRVFAPLGFENETWDVGPEGINPGGNGLSCRVVDMLKFGVLYLNDGLWNGQRILPVGWVGQSTRSRGDDYGYHWWTGPDGEFAAQGLFGQLIVVLPRYGAVVTTTNAMDRYDACSGYLIPLLRRHAASFFSQGSTAADERLAHRLAGEAQPEPVRSVARPGPGIDDRMKFRFEPNELGFETLELDFCTGKLVLRITEGRRVHRVTMGLDAWIEGETSMSGAQFHHGYEWESARVVASAHWINPQTIKMEWIFVETSFRDTVICRIEKGRVFLDRRVNVNSGRHEFPRMLGASASIDIDNRFLYS